MSISSIDPSELAAHPSAVDGAAVDLRARQRAVVLAYGRRQNSRSSTSAIMRDAASLIAETLQMPLMGSFLPCDLGYQLTLSPVDSVNEADQVTHIFPSSIDSMLSYAFKVGQPVASCELTSENRFRDRFLMDRGVVSVLIAPLRLDRRELGAVVVASPHGRNFSVDDLEFVETIVHLLTATLARVSAEASLLTERGTLCALMQSSDALIIVTDLDGNVTRINEACEQVCGFGNDELVGRSVWGTLAAPKDLKRVMGLFRTVTASGETQGCETEVLTKHGDQRRIRWAQAAIVDNMSRPLAVVISGVDITEQKRLEFELEQNRASMEKMQKAIADLLAQIEDENKTQHVAESAPPELDSQPFGPVSDSGEMEQLRSSPRRAYPYRQQVAPYLNGVLPSRGEFSEVQFRDISAGGVSFVLDHPPAFDMVVLALGCPPNFHYVSARVVNVSEELHKDGHNFIVGCCFVGRVHL